MSASFIDRRLAISVEPLGRRGRVRTDNHEWLAIIFMVAHVPLALIMHRVPQIATLHGYAALIVGLWFATTKVALRKIAYVGAYIVGAEVLWRMTRTDLPWEFGKYAVASIFIVALVRHGRWRMPLLPVIYFALLIPSVVPTVMNNYFDLEAVRQFISSNLSGPFALMACAWFFSHLNLTLAQLRNLFVAVIGPSIGIGVITLFDVLSAREIVWAQESNFVSSGGFGPNQVSAALGLGVLMALLFLVKCKSGYWVKAIMFLAMTFLAIQCAMTFSRGGLYGVLGAAILSGFYLSRDPRARVKLALVAVVVVVTATFIVLPGLDSFTSGALSERFKSTDSAGRTRLIESDFVLWDENPVLGAGVGMSYYRSGGWAASHTEFSRLVAEHGIFGFAAFILLMTSGWVRLRTARTVQGKALTAAMVGWSFLFMLDKAMRLVAPAFAFGLAFASLQPDDRNENGLSDLKFNA